MKLAVIGSRTFDDYNLLKATLDAIPDITIIVSGGANGADLLGERYAKEKGIPTKIFKPDWKMGRHAGLERNKIIIDYCDMVVAFGDGKSRGTKHSVTYAREKKKTIKVVRFPVA